MSDRGSNPSFRSRSPAADMFARPTVLVRQRAIRTLPLAAMRSNALGQRNLSQLSQSSSRISTVFGALLVVGAVTTSYGLCVYLLFTPGGHCIRSVE